MPDSLPRAWLAGALTPPVLGCALAGATVLSWPEAEGLRTLARIVDSLAPHLLALAALGALALAALGARRAAALALLIVLAGGGLGLQRHLAQSAPLAADRPAELTVLWFNVLGDNPTPPERLAAALAASPADLVILAEAAPLRGQMAALAAAFPVQAGCRARRCDLMVLGRGPVAAAEVRRIGRAAEERLALVRAAPEGAPALTVAAIHMVKPWFFGFAEHDEWHAADIVAAAEGPLLLAGDFNAAPWSRRLQELIGPCGLTLPRRPVATWPASAGAAGVPIDLVLVRDGARLVSLAPWGAGLGSNHRGLIAGVALAPPPEPPPPRPDCGAAR